MPYPILPAVGDNKYQHKMNFYTSPPPNYQTSVSSESDVSKHIKSLQARLGFARFKMKQGWETLTLLDVEQLWKQKQQKLINELPKPRFTQRDIIDKRVYIPSPGARHARAKKSKLIRTYSIPSQYSTEDCLFSTLPDNRNTATKPTLYFHHYHHQKEQQRRQDTHMMDCNQSTTSSDDDGEHTNKYKRYVAPAPPVRNSLDYLSYAIAMTEGEREEAEHNPMISSQPLPDISEMEPNLIDHYQEDNKKLDAIDELAELDVAVVKNENNACTEDEEKDNPPYSPITSAAKAIMMFVNSQPLPLPSATSNSSLYSQ